MYVGQRVCQVFSFGRRWVLLDISPHPNFPCCLILYSLSSDQTFVCTTTAHTYRDVRTHTQTSMWCVLTHTHFAWGHKNVQAYFQCSKIILFTDTPKTLSQPTRPQQWKLNYSKERKKSMEKKTNQDLLLCLLSGHFQASEKAPNAEETITFTNTVIVDIVPLGAEYFPPFSSPVVPLLHASFNDWW